MADDSVPRAGLIGLAGTAHQARSANLFTTVSDAFAKRLLAFGISHLLAPRFEPIEIKEDR